MKCLFYGRVFFALQQPTDPPFLLIPTEGSQCGLVTTAHTLCQMEMAGQEPDQETCPRVKNVCQEFPYKA